MKKLFLTLCLSFAVTAGFAASVAPVSAITLLDNTLIREASCVGENNKTIDGCKPSLNTFVKVGLNVSRIILGVVGALTLAMFVYGGFTLLISGGSSESVSRGKQIITGAVVGLIIVFVSYTVINFVINSILQAKVNNQPAFTGSAPTDNSGNTTPPTPCEASKGTCIPQLESCSGSTPQLAGCKANQQCCVPPAE